MVRKNEWYLNKVAVVTGAASGLGRSMTLALTRRGAFVHMVDIDAGGLGRVASEAGAIGGEVWTHEVDCSDEAAVLSLADEVYERHGHVDLLINNAGVVEGGPSDRISLDLFRHSFDVNVWGVIHGIHAFLPRMLKQDGRANVVNVASIAGLMGIPYMAPYCASKAAVVGLTESLAAELDRRKIQVTLVCPGAVRTPVMRHGHVELPGNWTERVTRLMERLGEDPDRVAVRILEAARAGQEMLVVAGGGLAPLWWMKRLSLHAYHGVARAIGIPGRQGR
ncbi:MAG: SDR family NAD(P)-dependent oxidoreductase [Deltaproteobacteria bacterium]|nr:SDR family NAD(P)-dependent oxidoreductase [Deltaproteobacteria bacterium]